MLDADRFSWSPEIYIPKAIKNNKNYSEVRQTGKWWVPNGVKGGAAKGNLLVSATELTAQIIQYNQGNRVEADFEEAVNQLYAVQSVVSNIQYGLDNNIIPDKYLTNLGDLANYMLDGQQPTYMTITKNEKGEEEITETVNNTLIKVFDNIIKKIGEKKKQEKQEKKSQSDVLSG